MTWDGIVYAKGYSLQSADYAEHLPASGDAEPGEVVALNAEGNLQRSSEPYQSTVAGIYSANPGLLGGADIDGSTDGKIPLAIVGVVPVKVSAENGAIAPGDLLTSASLPGHAMRCDEDDPCFGRTIGKAMQSHAEGTGMIQILVSLQ